MRKLKSFIPALVCVVISIIITILYFTVYDNHNVGEGLIILTIPLISLIIPLFSLIINKEIPLFLNIMLIILSYSALVGGTTFNLYDKITWWDLYCHTYFGFFICFYFYYLFLNKAFTKKEPILFIILTSIFVLAFAGLWEVVEFTFDGISGQDSQRVWESIYNGHQGTYDTIVDILVAMIGLVIYVVFYIIDYKNGLKLHNKLMPTTLFDEKE